MKKGNLTLWLVLGSAGLLFFILCLAAFVMLPDSSEDGWEFAVDQGQVGLVEIEGLIYDPQPILDLLKSYRKRTSVKALLLRINSPGGGAAASQEIYSELLRLRRETGKKVVASLGSVAASGGYYIACAADKVVANPATITGSIGVLAEWVNWADLMEWAKLKSVVFKSGEFKDTGNPTRAMTDAEKKYFQELIDSLYRQFVRDVSQSRGMTVAQLTPLADGRVFTGEDAHRLGLVDELGNYQDAISLAAKLAGVAGEPKLIVPKKKRTSLWDLLNGTASVSWPLVTDPSLAQVRFEYLWR